MIYLKCELPSNLSNLQIMENLEKQILLDKVGA